MKLLLTGAFKYSNEQLNKLEEIGYNLTLIQDERMPLDIDVSEIDAVVCNSLFLYNDIEIFKRLKVIHLTSAGMDRIPLDYIKKKGIKIFNARGVYSIPMAEWAVLKILEIYKKSKYFYENQKQHKWLKYRNLFELTNKTAVIVGFGNVGIEIAKRLKAFEVNVLGVDIRRIESDYVDESLLIGDIDETFKKSDIIILTLPLSEATRHLLNSQKINLIKDNAVLINMSRGALIEENALIEALKRGKFLGVALDVFENEPLGISPLWDFKNVIITPHNSFVSDKVNERLFNLILDNLNSFRVINTKG